MAEVKEYILREGKHLTFVRTSKDFTLFKPVTWSDKEEFMADLELAALLSKTELIPFNDAWDRTIIKRMGARCQHQSRATSQQ